jgi:Protein of unknown function with PCYCGC motif
MSSARVAIGAAALALGLSLTACGSDAPAPQPAQQPAPSAAAPAQPPNEQPASPTAGLSNDLQQPVVLSDAEIPPIPVTQFPYARPAEVVRAVYAFAARHPEVLSHVPCFCGCESSGHRHNDDCFVKARDARGRPTAWEPHGVG